MLRDPEHLLDILNAAKLARKYIQKLSKEQFLEDSQCQDAVIRRLEVIGEASRRISAETRAQLSHLPWDAMIGMRNVMIHEYDDVDMAIVWATVKKDIPALIKLLETVLE
jgi:uncharacterized protein with HEPN domain